MHRPWRPAVVLLAVSILLGPQSSAALEFDMLFQTKCVMEEINRGVLVVGDFAAFEKEHPDKPVEMDVKARDTASGGCAQCLRHFESTYTSYAVRQRDTVACAALRVRGA